MKKFLQTASPAATGQVINKKIHWILVTWIITIALLDIITSTDNLPKGIKFYTMETNSMDPIILVNSLFITKPYPFYQINEIVTFEFPGNKEIVTHRIVNLSKQNNQTYYITKGDNNDLVDRRLIPPENIFGKVIIVIPFLGWLVRFIQTKLGLAILVVIPATLVARKEILIIIKELSKSKK